MRRLILWITALIAVFSLTALIPILIGRRQPLPERVAMLHLTDCELPCWIGIVPGTSTVGEARKQVTQIYEILSYGGYLQESNGYTMVAFTSDTSFQFDDEYRGADHSTVQDIWLWPPNVSISVGDLHSVLGEPNAISLGEENDPIVFVSFPHHIYLRLYRNPCGSVTPHQDVVGIGMYSLPISFASPALPSDFRPWRGFRTCYNPTP